MDRLSNMGSNYVYGMQRTYINKPATDRVLLTAIAVMRMPEYRHIDIGEYPEYLKKQVCENCAQFCIRFFVSLIYQGVPIWFFTYLY
jgi:hypothetical protein